MDKEIEKVKKEFEEKQKRKEQRRKEREKEKDKDGKKEKEAKKEEDAEDKKDEKERDDKVPFMQATHTQYTECCAPRFRPFRPKTTRRPMTVRGSSPFTSRYKLH